MKKVAEVVREGWPCSQCELNPDFCSMECENVLDTTTRKKGRGIRNDKGGMNDEMASD